MRALFREDHRSRAADPGEATDNENNVRIHVARIARGLRFVQNVLRRSFPRVSVGPNCGERWWAPDARTTMMSTCTNY